MSKIVVLLFILFSFPVTSEQTHLKNYIFNLTGSMQGYGDITGPFWTMLKIKEKRPNIKYSVVIDSRAQEILSKLYNKSLSSISKDLGIQFYTLEDAEKIPKADVAFELFFGGRKIHSVPGEHSFINLVYDKRETVTIISDTMHGTTLDEVVGPDFEFYFKPPGIGKDRSGIINAPDLEKLKDKPIAVQRTIAASLFNDINLKDLIIRKHQHDVLFSFLYGAHNEIFEQELIGQTKLFVGELGKKYANTPIIVFTPNSKDELKKILPDFNRVFSVDELGQLRHLSNQVYLISVPGITGFQFAALMAIADLPVLIEGNSTVSLAIRLKKQFLMYRSPWNGPQIKNLQEIDEDLAKSFIYSDVYDLSKLSLPYFAHYFSKDSYRKLFAAYDLSRHAPDFPTKLIQILNLIERLENHQNPINYSKLSEQIFQKTSDPYLAYSLVVDAKNRGKIPVSLQEKARANILARGQSWKDMEARFIPNKPNFSQKIIELENRSFAKNETQSKEKTGAMAQNSDIILVPGVGTGMFAVLDEALTLVAGYEWGYFSSIEINFEKMGLYYDAAHGANWWTYYFSPIKIGEQKVHPQKISSVSYDTILHPETSKINRLEANQLIKKYFHIKSHIKKMTDQFVKDNFDNHYIIGIHYRGTDKISEAPRVSYEKTTEELNRVIETLNEKDYRIFVATDEAAFLKHIKTKFPRKIIYNKEAIRSLDGKPVHFDDSQNKYEIGENALIDCLLLSRTNILIRTSSNLSRWSTYFNPHIPVIEISKRY